MKPVRKKRRVGFFSTRVVPELSSPKTSAGNSNSRMSGPLTYRSVGSEQTLGLQRSQKGFGSRSFAIMVSSNLFSVFCFCFFRFSVSSVSFAVSPVSSVSSAAAATVSFAVSSVSFAVSSAVSVSVSSVSFVSSATAALFLLLFLLFLLLILLLFLFPFLIKQILVGRAGMTRDNLGPLRDLRT